MWSISKPILFLGLLIQLALALRPVIRDYTDPTSPASQFRLAFDGPTGLTVSWSSPGFLKNPTVSYGTDPNNLDASAVGTSTTFDTATVYDNHVSISGLEPYTKYYYSVTNLDVADLETEGFYFTTARAAGDETGFTIGIFADLGIVIGNLFDKQIPDTFASVEGARSDYEFLWHSGDFGYADDWLWEELTGVYPLSLESGTATYNNIMNSYYDQFVNVTKNTVYMTGPGNHEADCIEPDLDPITDEFGITICSAGQRNFTGYLNHFNMPTNNQATGFYQNMWYSWDYGMVHFIQLNTETDLAAGVTAPDEPGGSGDLDGGPFGAPNQQLNWLAADLAAVDRTKTPWIVVAGHRPWYTAASSSLCSDCQSAFEDTILKYNVDLVWFGHVHYYERDLPVANGVVDPNGLNNPSAPWYITTGAGGNYEGHSTPDSTLPDYTVVVNDADYGWSKLIFHNSSYLTQQFISSETNEILDQATLYKNHGLNW